MADLWERLRRAQTQLELRAEESALPDSDAGLAEEAPSGWEWRTPLVAERTFTFELDPEFWEAVAPHLDPEAWKRVLCFDTETTGLSGGAGTVAFLIGWASLVPLDGGRPRVELKQWFLRDLPGEPELLRLVDEALTEARALVSFNGASYDLPLLRSRWSLVGRSFPILPHRDDLHPARRLWKRLLDSCRLSRLEETVLGIRRSDDVPGSLVPALWFDYLRRGASPDFAKPLEGVLRHHAQDLYSLLCLDLLLHALAATPSSQRWEETFGAFPHRQTTVKNAREGLLHPDLGSRTPVDFWGLLGLRDRLSQESRLETVWKLRPSETLGLAWADRLKRKRDGRAPEVWRTLWETKRSYSALEELLKWLEHRVRTKEARAEALLRIEQAFKAPFLPQLWRARLERRRVRLLKD